MRLLSTIITMIAFVLSFLLGTSPAAIATAQSATPAADCPTTTEDQNEAIARRWYDEAINQGKLDVIDEIAAPDIIHHGGTFPDSEGTESVKGVLGKLRTGFPDVKHTIHDVITEDDLVVVRWTATGTHTGEFQGVEPTGKQATWTGVGIFRFECGKIVEDWSEVDGVGRLQQLGAIATPTP